MKNYEIYLADDAGRRITLLNNIAFMDMSRSVMGYGTIHIGIPFDDYKVRPAFLPDRRIEVWRKPSHGATMRREGSFFLRKYNVYTRESDSVQIVEFWGRDPKDILRRQPVSSGTPANYNKTAAIDNMMKEIVDENFVTPPQTAPDGEFSVDGDESLGPVVSHSFQGQNVLDVLKDLRDISISLNEASVVSTRIYFDVVESDPLSNGGFGYAFRTYATLRGVDRTNGVIFSVENGNIRAPSYFEDHLDSKTMATVISQVSSDLDINAELPDRTLSRWNDIRVVQGSSEKSAEINSAIANQMLHEGQSERALNVTFLDSPGSERQPRSLYGVDWDLGDLLPVRYADLDFHAEVMVIYLAVNEDQKENIVGMNSLRALPPSDTTPIVVFLILAGGGGGGFDAGGGGGAGGIVTGTIELLSNTEYTVVVGAGGAGSAAGANKGTSGSDSSFAGATALGGGGGGSSSNAAGANGGSGGGARSNSAAAGGTGNVDQGHNGGGAPVGAGGGGGGGAGTVGADGSAGGAGFLGGDGGAGESNSITGIAVLYGGGGGGASNGAAAGGVGGTGGGGNGGNNAAAAGNGTVNLGGGGGGGGVSPASANGGNGGSGVVIIKIRTAAYSGIYSGAPAITVSGLYTILTFNANGSYTT